MSYRGKIWLMLIAGCLVFHGVAIWLVGVFVWVALMVFLVIVAVFIALVDYLGSRFET